MKIQTAAGVGCCLLIAASAGLAQSGGVDAALDRAVADCRIANVKGYLEKVRASVASLKPGVELPPGEADRRQRERACALRLAGDVRDLEPDSPWARAPLVCYTVPAISAVKRLPDTLPPDGIAGDSITVIAAQGEYEPASFVVFPLADVGALEVKAGELAGTKGRIPVECVDVKVVKCWYQAGTAWGSYFADRTRRELTPELLLNDDDLVRVDLDRRENYLRVDYAEGPRYVWVSYPLEAGSSKLNYALDPVQDSPALRPVQLRQGMARQFWITIKVPEKAAGGLYHGRIALTADGKSVGNLRLAVRVLPFTLPLPMTYYDPGREFYTFMYHRCGLETHLKLTGGDLQVAEKRLAAELRNMREHNLNYFMMPDYGRTGRDAFIRTLQLMKEAGLRTRPLFDAINIGVHTPQQVESKKRTVTEAMALIEKVLGHRDVYAFGADEPGRKALLAEQPLWDLTHRLGARTYSTGTVRHFPLVGYSEDFCNLGGAPKREQAAQWHAVGGRITSYASPHTGPESPDLARRNHGMLLYKAWYDGSGNYIYYEAAGPDIWNDFGDHYRNFNMVYPTRGGVIDTIAWEGFREGIDDVRYATHLKTLAAQAIAGNNVDAVYAGKKALMWLELLDEKSVDLNTMRGEMINHILKLTGILEGGKS